MIKAIETRFDNYHFRSRIEARWAVFFKTLEIPYEYEKEGYDLGGTWYLPDFWLPELETFVEIKGQEPTEEEIRKFKLLSLYTGKQTALISGNIGLPGELYIHDIQLTASPSLFVSQMSAYKQTSQHRYRETSPEVLSILQRVEDVELKLYVEETSLLIAQNSPGRLIGGIERLAEIAQKQQQVLTAIKPLLETHQDDLIQALTVEEGWVVSFRSQPLAEGIEWVECDQCGYIDFGVPDFPHYECSSEIQGKLHNNSPGLIEAYTAARQARFERYGL